MLPFRQSQSDDEATSFDPYHSHSGLQDHSPVPAEHKVPGNRYDTMRLLVLVAIVLLVSPIALTAQSFDQLIMKGDSLYDVELYQQSASAYEQALQQSEGTASQYYNAACSLALASDTTKALRYLALATDQGWKNVKHLKRDKDLRSLHECIGWPGILSAAQVNLDEYEKDLDLPLKRQLEEIYVKDQTLRQLYKSAEDKFGRDSEEMVYFWQLVNQQDSLNEIEVAQIIDRHGWVGTSQVGGKANASLWLVIQHAPLDVQTRYLPLLQQSVLAGESRGSHLALLEDRIQMRNGDPQTYGSQIVTDDATGEQIVYEIKDPQYADYRRQLVGLGPISEYLKRWGIKWSVKQLTPSKEDK